MVNVQAIQDKNQKETPSKKDLTKKNSKTGSKNATHVYLHDKYLEKMVKLPISSALTTLYLHGNLISRIENLEGAINLTHLYLQKNKIKKIENLNHLKRLKKLYLGHNEISVLEGLDRVPMLEELHLEKQDIAKSDSLCFEPRTMYNIGKSLQVINVSYNNISSLDGLEHLRFLKTLDASYNKLDNTKTICDAIQSMYYLHEATFAGNPVTKLHRYREDIIGHTYRLDCLDGKIVNETTRCFIKRFDHEKKNFSSKQNLHLNEQIAEISKSYPALQKAVSASILKTHLSKDSFDTSGDTATYIPWNALPGKSADTTNRIPPLLRKHRKRAGKPPAPSTNIVNFNPFDALL